MFLFNVYMYVIYISSCIDIINSVYLLLIFNYGLVALVLCILHHVVVGHQPRSTTNNNHHHQKTKKKHSYNSLWPAGIVGMHILQYLLFKVFQIIIPGYLG